MCVCENAQKSHSLEGKVCDYQRCQPSPHSSSGILWAKSEEQNLCSASRPQKNVPRIGHRVHRDENLKPSVCTNPTCCEKHTHSNSSCACHENSTTGSFTAARVVEQSRNQSSAFTANSSRCSCGSMSPEATFRTRSSFAGLQKMHKLRLGGNNEITGIS